jgi:hypothetical protein
MDYGKFMGLFRKMMFRRINSTSKSLTNDLRDRRISITRSFLFHEQWRYKSQKAWESIQLIRFLNFQIILLTLIKARNIASRIETYSLTFRFSRNFTFYCIMHCVINQFNRSSRADLCLCLFTLYQVIKIANAI